MSEAPPENAISRPGTAADEKSKKALEFIEDVTTNAGEFQKKVLEEILSCSAHVEYFQRHDLNGRTSRESFKKMIHVVTYEDIQSDINRIANGDASPILCSEPISEFFKSSGTSGGESKFMPTHEDDIQRRFVFGSLLMPVISQFVPCLENGKGMHFSVMKAEVKTPGGLLARPLTTSLYKRSLVIQRERSGSHDPFANFTSPSETVLCIDTYQSMYSQVLCGLLEHKQVLHVGATFASTFIRIIRFLEKHWQLLCSDIRSGTIDHRITDPSVREAVMKILKPDPNLADFIETECKKDSWQGIITRLWSNTKYVGAIVTGTMSQYIPTLDYYSNGLPLVSAYYASSECVSGLNLKPLSKPSEVDYTFMPTMAYFEFLPFQINNGDANEKEKEELVDLVDVKLGQEYELVVTTYAGLYRYKVGDVLRVAGFKNKAPQFNFTHRKNVVLNIESDNTNEVELQTAVKNAVNHLATFDVVLSEYTSSADTTTSPGHYVLFWELNLNMSTKIPPGVFEDCCLILEESLSSQYRQGRVSNKSIGPLEIKIVEPGTFDKLMGYSISLGASINQYKTPRCVKSAPIVELLNSRVVSRYFSPKCPTWSLV